MTDQELKDRVEFIMEEFPDATIKDVFSYQAGMWKDVAERIAFENKVQHIKAISEKLNGKPNE